jgi:hypothetical protein
MEEGKIATVFEYSWMQLEEPTNIYSVQPWGPQLYGASLMNCSPFVNPVVSPRQLDDQGNERR